MSRIKLIPQKNSQTDSYYFLYKLYSDPNISATYFNNVSRPSTHEDIKDYIRNLLDWDAYKGYLIAFDDKLIGEVGVLNGTLNVVLMSQYQGLGLAKEALQEIMKVYPNKLFTATILSDNIASIRLFESLGFVKTGRNEAFELDIYTLEM